MNFYQSSKASSTQVTIARDVPGWLLDYGNNLDWRDSEVAALARREVKNYLSKLPQKKQPWRSGDISDYQLGIIPSDVLEDISSINWHIVPSLVQAGIKALLP